MICSSSSSWSKKPMGRKNIYNLIFYHLRFGNTGWRNMKDYKWKQWKEKKLKMDQSLWRVFFIATTFYWIFYNPIVKRIWTIIVIYKGLTSKLGIIQSFFLYWQHTKQHWWHCWNTLCESNLNMSIQSRHNPALFYCCS